MSAIVMALLRGAVMAMGAAALKIASAMLTERVFLRLFLELLEQLAKRTETKVDDKLLADARRALAPALGDEPAP